MTRGSARLVAVVAGLVTGVATLLVATPHAQAADPVRILIEGDSITQGFNGDFTWRYRLARELRRQGVDFDLVGSKSGPFVKPGYTSSRYADPSFDSDHFAQASTTIGWHLARVRDEVAQQHPDVVVFAAGVNDLREGTSPQAADDRLRAWVAQVRAAAPTVRIIISPVLDATDSARPWLLSRIREFRSLEAATVADLTTSSSPITLADTARGWSVPAFTTDNLHPNATGETFIAQRVAEAMQRVGLLPAAPRIYRSTAWTWAARLQVRQVGRHLRLTWDPQALDSARIWVKRVGGGRASLVNRYYTGTYTTPTLRRGARYAVRVQFVRGRAVTSWTPATRVKIRKPTRPAAVRGAVIDSTGVHWNASARATRYVVELRTVGSKRWQTRRTRSLQVLATGVTRAKVRAVNAAGSSPYRNARR